MIVSIENLDTVLLLCGNLAEQLVCQFRAAHSRYITTSSTEEVCGAKDLKVFATILVVKEATLLHLLC
jgi:hypothetical protein